MHDAALLDEIVVSRRTGGIPLARLLALAGLPAPLSGATGRGETVVTGLAHDSTRVVPGDLFVAIRGRRDGADFAAYAVGRGAVAVVSASDDRRLSVPWIVVPDDRAALADIAAAFHGHPSEKLLVLGLTGTNGKTTASNACAGILGAAGTPVGVVCTVEARWPGHAIPASRTTPEAPDLQRLLADMVDDGCAAAVVEVSSHGIDLQRVRALRFAATAFTNLSQDHLDWHGDLETYYRSKRRLFTELAREAPAVICVDDEHGLRLARELRAAAGRTVVSVGFSIEADLRIADFAGDAAGSRFRLAGSVGGSANAVDIDIPVILAMPGRHNAQNAAVAAGLALVTGAPPDFVRQGLAGLSGVPGRLEPVTTGGATDISVLVDYAHTPAALEGVLSAARGFTAGRLICVFGCGGDKDRAKRAPMGDAVGRLADVAVITSDNPRSEDPLAIIAAARTGLDGKRAEVIVEPDRRAAIGIALDIARPGDVVIVAGKGHETYQEIAGRRIPFDDRVVAKELLLRRSGA